MHHWVQTGGPRDGKSTGRGSKWGTQKWEVHVHALAIPDQVNHSKLLYRQNHQSLDSEGTLDIILPELSA